MNAYELLKQYSPCCVGYLECRTIEQALDDCIEPDWLIWAFDRLVNDQERSMKAKAKCCQLVTLNTWQQSIVDAAIEGVLPPLDKDRFVVPMDLATWAVYGLYSFQSWETTDAIYDLVKEQAYNRLMTEAGLVNEENRRRIKRAAHRKGIEAKATMCNIIKEELWTPMPLTF